MVFVVLAAAAAATVSCGAAGSSRSTVKAPGGTTLGSKHTCDSRLQGAFIPASTPSAMAIRVGRQTRGKRRQAHLLGLRIRLL